MTKVNSNEESVGSDLKTKQSPYMKNIIDDFKNYSSSSTTSHHFPSRKRHKNRKMTSDNHPIYDVESMDSRSLDRLATLTNSYSALLSNTSNYINYAKFINSILNNKIQNLNTNNNIISKNLNSSAKESISDANSLSNEFHNEKNKHKSRRKVLDLPVRLFLIYFSIFYFKIVRYTLVLIIYNLT